MTGFLILELRFWIWDCSRVSFIVGKSLELNYCLRLLSKWCIGASELIRS